MPLTTVVASLLGLALPASGQTMHFPAHLDASVQVVLSDAQRFAGTEIQASASIMSLGVVLGVAWEEVLPDDHGGYVHLGVRWHPVALATKLFRHMDAWIGFGGLLGGHQDGFRGAGYVGVGLTLAARVGTVGPAVFLQYRYQGDLQSPDAAAEHVLTVGAGIRWSN